KTMEKYNIAGYKLVLDAEGDVLERVVREAIKEAKRLLRPSLLQFRGRHRVGIYSGGWVKSHGGSRMGAKFGWLADYTAFDRPAHWSRRFTKLWQFTSNNGK